LYLNDENDSVFVNKYELNNDNYVTEFLKSIDSLLATTSSNTSSVTLVNDNIVTVNAIYDFIISPSIFKSSAYDEDSSDESEVSPIKSKRPAYDSDSSIFDAPTTTEYLKQQLN
jgi:hypothetical protein